MAEKLVRKQLTQKEVADKVAMLENMRLKAVLKSLPRGAGGQVKSAIYHVIGDPADIEAYKEVMGMIADRRPQNAGMSILSVDNLTGRPLFFLPNAANGNEVNLMWASGDPAVNPLGRFIVDTRDKDVAIAQANEQFATREFELLRVKDAFARRFGGIQTAQPAGGGAQQTLSPEEIEARIAAQAEQGA